MGRAAGVVFLESCVWVRGEADVELFGDTKGLASLRFAVTELTNTLNRYTLIWYKNAW